MRSRGFGACRTRGIGEGHWRERLGCYVCYCIIIITILQSLIYESDDGANCRRTARVDSRRETGKRVFDVRHNRNRKPSSSLISDRRRRGGTAIPRVQVTERVQLQMWFRG